ncbi:hypothetical protein [Shewanella glacialipiscicola]|uniref:hypothetical protein n=1 Tax=Shewanella glacialipiscicola TaxID=614069 RepID=UPI003D790AC4
MNGDALSKITVEVRMHGRDLVSNDAEICADMLAAQCAAVSEMIRLIAILPDHCLRNIQILPHNVVRAITKTAPSLHYLYLRTLAKCIEVTQIDDSVELGEEDLELVRCYFLTLSKMKHTYEPLASTFDDVDSLLEDGYVLTFNLNKAFSLHLNLSFADAERQTVEVATQLDAISKGTSVGEFVKRWPRYSPSHYRKIAKTIGCDSSVEQVAMEEATKSILQMLSIMNPSDLANVTIIPSLLAEKLVSICPNYFTELIDPLMSCLSVKEYDDQHSMSATDKGLSFVFWHTIASHLHNYEPLFHVRHYAESLSTRYSLHFSLNTVECERLNRKVDQLQDQSFTLTKQYNAVNAGIGHDLFFKWWPDAEILRFRELRAFSGVKLDSGHTLSAKVEYGIYGYYCQVLDQVKQNDDCDDENAMIKAWQLTQNKFGEIMPLASFIVAQQS